MVIPAILLLGVYPKEMKIHVHTEICTSMFIEVVFIVAKKCKEDHCLPTDEWINNL